MEAIHNASSSIVRPMLFALPGINNIHSYFKIPFRIQVQQMYCYTYGIGTLDQSDTLFQIGIRPALLSRLVDGKPSISSLLIIFLSL